MEKFRLGFAPTRRFIFSKEDAFRHKNMILAHIRQYEDIEVVDIEGINSEGLLFDSNDDQLRVIDLFREQKVDAVFFPHCNFGTEDAVARVAKAIGKPVLLWGPRDEAPLPDGNRLRDSQCGLFATGKVLRLFNVPFSYIVNCRLDDAEFGNGFRKFIAAANVVKAMKNLRVLQVSTRPASFRTMMFNEGELLERFGIEVIPVTLHEIEKAMDKAIRANGQELQDTVNFIRANLDCGAAKSEAVVKVAALKVTLKKLVRQNLCKAVALQCWSSMQDAMGIMPCLCNALLTDEGIPVTCETDVHGAITAVMAQAAAMGRAATFFADLTIRHPENDNGELLFHCGNFPISLSKCKPKFGSHFIFGEHLQGTGEGEIKGGDISIVRFDGDHSEYSLFLGRARGISGPYTRGSYLWIEVDNWPKWEEKLVTGPYVHHCVGIHQDVLPVLEEACRFIPGLKADPVDSH